MDALVHLVLDLLTNVQYIQNISILLEKNVQERQQSTQSIVMVFLILSAIPPLPILLLFLSGNGTISLYMYGTLGAIAIEIILIHCLVYLLDKIRQYNDRTFADQAMMLTFTAMAEQPPGHKAFLLMSQAIVSASRQAIHVQERVDAITGEEFAVGEMVYILDDNRTTPVKHTTLLRLYDRDDPSMREGRNPFTNMAVRKITKVRIQSFAAA
jgi:hypothetical protein